LLSYLLPAEKFWLISHVFGVPVLDGMPVVAQ